MKTEDKIKLVEARADAIKGMAQISDDGKITFEQNAYLNDLPDGLTEEHIKKLGDHHSIVFPAMVKVAGDLAIPYLAAHSEAEKVEFVAPGTGHNKFSGTINRDTERRNPSTGETTTVHGAVRTTWTDIGAKGSGSVMKHITDGISEAAAKAFGK